MFVPNFFKNLDTQTAQFVGMIIAVLIIGGFAYMQKKKPTKKEEYEE
jgi:glucose uptake protein GlcU